MQDQQAPARHARLFELIRQNDLAELSYVVKSVTHREKPVQPALAERAIQSLAS